jgi:CP family cyanate transporter-like MFS transporter
LGARALGEGLRRRWWPDWRSRLVWRLGLLTGSVNSLYFTMNFFLPDYLASQGEADWVATVLTVLNLGQVPGSFLMLAVAGRWGRRPLAYIGSAALALTGILGTLLCHGLIRVAFAGLFGCATTVTFVLCFALPALLSEPDDVHRTSAAMFTLSYTCAVITPVVGGLLWDMTGIPLMAFAPVIIWPMVTWVMAMRVDLQHRPAGAAA